jgi:hypothetical protein
MDVNKYYYNLTQLKLENQLVAMNGTVNGANQLFVNQNYFQSMGTRLYNFNGEAFTPTKVYTIPDNKTLSEFPTFADAKASGAKDFFSIDTNSSPVPLEVLKHFRQIHSESDTRGGVKLFEVVD